MAQKAGLKNEELLRRLQISGSAAILSRNEFGVHLFTERELKDGVVGARLAKTNYNLDELQRSINTTISELIPIEAPELPDMVLREDFEELQGQLDETVREITELNERIQALQSENATLESRIESLEFDKDNLELLRSIAENRLDTLSDQLASNIQDLQYAIQKATTEAVRRVSLSARNDVLNEENARLRDALAGRDAQLAEGAQLAGGITILNLDQPPADIREDVYYRWERQGGIREFYSGERWQVTNTSEGDVTISIAREDTSGTSIIAKNGWFDISNTQFTLQAGQTQDIRLTVKPSIIEKLAPTGWLGRSRAYDGRLIFNISTTDQTIRYVTRLRKEPRAS